MKIRMTKCETKVIMLVEAAMASKAITEVCPTYAICKGWMQLAREYSNKNIKCDFSGDNDNGFSNNVVKSIIDGTRSVIEGMTGRDVLDLNRVLYILNCRYSSACNDYKGVFKFFGVDVTSDDWFVICCTLNPNSGRHYCGPEYIRQQTVASKIDEMLSKCTSDEDKSSPYYEYLVEEFVFQLLYDRHCFDVYTLDRYIELYPEHKYFMEKAIQLASVARRACLVGGMIS